MLIRNVLILTHSTYKLKLNRIMLEKKDVHNIHLCALSVYTCVYRICLMRNTKPGEKYQKNV